MPALRASIFSLKHAGLLLESSRHLIAKGFSRRYRPGKQTYKILISVLLSF